MTLPAQTVRIDSVEYQIRQLEENYRGPHFQAGVVGQLRDVRRFDDALLYIRDLVEYRRYRLTLEAVLANEPEPTFLPYDRAFGAFEPIEMDPRKFINPHFKHSTIIFGWASKYSKVVTLPLVDSACQRWVRDESARLELKHPGARIMPRMMFEKLYIRTRYISSMRVSVHEGIHAAFTYTGDMTPRNGLIIRCGAYWKTDVGVYVPGYPMRFFDFNSESFRTVTLPEEIMDLLLARIHVKVQLREFGDEIDKWSIWAE